MTSINFYVGDKLVAGAAFDSDTWELGKRYIDVFWEFNV